MPLVENLNVFGPAGGYTLRRLQIKQAFAISNKTFSFAERFRVFGLGADPRREQKTQVRQSTKKADVGKRVRFQTLQWLYDGFKGK